jgi:hypothetical protein
VKRAACIAGLLGAAMARTPSALAGPAHIPAAPMSRPATLAVVVQDQTALRAAPSDRAAQQAVLWRGDLLEVRGDRIDHLQVWDHRRERAGYVRASQLRPLHLLPHDAPQLLAVLRFLRDTPGAESLGIAYVAAYLRASPAAQIGAEPFDALGTMAERLAGRASGPSGGQTLAAHLEVAAQYGVRFNSIAHDGRLQLCYDGEAFRQVLALAATTPGAVAAETQASAALALSRPDCVNPDLRPDERLARHIESAALLDRLPLERWTALPTAVQNRVRLRRADTWASVAFQQGRAGHDATAAARRAIDELTAVDRDELGDDDQVAYNNVAIHVGASRWAALPALPPSGALALRSETGEPGQTCLVLGPSAAPLARRCTFGTVWMSSARVSPNGRVAVVAVEPLDGWTELWVLRRDSSNGNGPAWQVDVLPPASCEPGLGYIEFAGWVPGGRRMLVSRETRNAEGHGRWRRSFEVVSLDSLNTVQQTASARASALFAKWQDPRWRQGTLSLR